MPARLSLVTPPAREPFTLEDAKLFARVDTDNTNEDPLLVDLIAATRRRCEEIQGSAYITQTWDYFLDCFPSYNDTPYAYIDRLQYNVVDAAIVLPLQPIQSITSITYTLTDNSVQTINASDYVLDKYSRPPRVVPAYGKFWPRDLLQSANGVAIRFVAGYGANESDVPNHLRLAMKQLLGFWYLNRDAMPDVPPEIDALLSSASGGFAYA